MDSQNNTLESAQTCKDRESENVKVFVLTPSDLASIGLITKVENGQAVLLPAKKSNNVDTSTTLSQIIARKRSLNFKDVVTAETHQLDITCSSASASPSVMKNPKRKGSDEQDVTITIVKQNDINAGLNVATARNVEDVTVTVSKLTPASTSILKSDVTSPQIKRSCGNNVHGTTSLLGKTVNSTQMTTAIGNKPCGPATELRSGMDASQVKAAGGNNSHGNTNVLGKGVTASPVKTGCGTNPRRPYEEKEKWTPNLLKRTCKLIPMNKQVQPMHTPQQQTSSSSAAVTDDNSASSSANNPVRTRARRMLSGFAQYWLNSLKDIGYIRCPLRACNYISLSYQDMSAHYATCAGVSITSENMCPVCQKRLNTAENVKLHLIRSHGPKSKQQEESQSKPSKKRVPKEDPPPRLLVRKRGYSKVHKISWTISLEQKGYIRCLFQNCGFLALNMEEMIQHYGICNGSGSSAHIPCPFCSGRVENLDKLDKHILISHAEESKKADTQTESTDVVGTPEVKPALSHKSCDQKDSQKMKVGQSDTPESFATNVSKLHSHEMDQTQKATEYILPDFDYEDLEGRVNNVKSFSNIPAKNGLDSLEKIMTDSYGENNFLEKLVPEKPKDSLNIRFSDCQSNHCEVVGAEVVESNRNHVNAQEKISEEGYNVQISETLVVSVDPHDITEAEGISTNRLASEFGYETVSLNISDVTELQKGIKVTQHNVNSVPSSKESAAMKININKSDEKQVPLTSTAVSGCDVPVIQTNTLNMKNLNKSDSVFSSNANVTHGSHGVISISDLCSENNKQEILTNSSADTNCFNISNISSDNSNIAGNDTVCADNLDISSETWQKTSISCSSYIQSKTLMLSDSCGTEIRKPLSDVNKLAETVPYINKESGSHIAPSQKDLFTSSLPSSQGLDHIKNVKNIGSSPNVQQRLVCKDDIDIDLLSYSALSGEHTIVYSDRQWESKLSAVPSGLESSPCEKIVTDKSRLKTYSKKNSPSSLTDQRKNQKSPCYTDSQILFDRPPAVNFEEDVYINKGIEATVAAVSTLCHSNQYNEEHVPVEDGGTQECDNKVIEDCQSNLALPQKGSKCLGTVATGTVMDKNLLNIDIDTCPDGGKAHITPGVIHKQKTDAHGNSLSGSAASADHLSPSVHDPAVVEENKNFHCIKLIEQPVSADVSSEVQRCVDIANTATQDSKINVSSVSDGSFMASSVENICDDNRENKKQAFCNMQMNVYELESSKEEQNELTTKPSIANFVQEMNIDYINSEADKFIIEDESLSMYLNNSDEFQDKNLLENDTALTPIGSCEHNQDTIMLEKSSPKGAVTATVKERSESTPLQNTVSCDRVSTERRDTDTLMSVSYDKIPDATLSTEIGKTHVTTETKVPAEPAGSNMQSKDDKRHSSYNEEKSVAITLVDSDKQVVAFSSSVTVPDEAIDNACLSTASVMDDGVKENIKTLYEKQFPEKHEASLAVNTADTILNVDDAPCTLCMEEQGSNVPVIKNTQKCLNDKTEHYDKAKEYNPNNNCLDIRSEDLVISSCDLPVLNSTKEEPSIQSVCSVSFTYNEHTVQQRQYEEVCSIYPQNNKSECTVTQTGRGDELIRKVKDEPSEKIMQSHEEFNVHCGKNSLTNVTETRVDLNYVEMKNVVPSTYLPKCDLPISNQERKTNALSTSLIEECKSETEGVKSNELNPDVTIANDVKVGKTKNISVFEVHLSEDSNEGQLKNESKGKRIEPHKVHCEINSSTHVKGSTNSLDDVEMKNTVPTECSLKPVLPLSNQTSKATPPSNSSVKECKTETENVKQSGLDNFPLISNDVKEEKPTDIPMSELHLSEDSNETSGVPVKYENCIETPSDPTVEKDSEGENLENLKAGVTAKDANETSQPQQSDFSQHLVSSVTSSHDVECRLTAVHPNANSQQLIIDPALTDNNRKLPANENPPDVKVMSSCGSAMPIKSTLACSSSKVTSRNLSEYNSNSLVTSNSEDTPQGSSVNPVSVDSVCDTSCSQQLDEESFVCMDKTGAVSNEECTTPHNASSGIILPVKKVLNHQEHVNDQHKQPTGDTVTLENNDHGKDFNRSVRLFDDSAVDKVPSDVGERVSADASLMSGHADGKAAVLSCKNVSSVNNKVSNNGKLKSDNPYEDCYLCDREIPATGNDPASETDVNSKENEKVQNLPLPRENEGIIATSGGQCKEKINFDDIPQIPLKVCSRPDPANITVTATTSQGVNCCLLTTESMEIDLKLNAGSDVTVCNASVPHCAPEAVKTGSSPNCVKENTENVSSAQTLTSVTLVENNDTLTALSCETGECVKIPLQVDEKSNSEEMCDKNTTTPLLPSKICRKRKNSECANTDNSNSKIQILEVDCDKLAVPSCVKATAETTQCQPGYNRKVSTENLSGLPERKLQLSSNVSDSHVMSTASKPENTEETSDSLKTSVTDDSGDTLHCREYSEFTETRDVNESRVNSQNGELLENNNVGVSEVMKSNNNQLSLNNCNNAERIRSKEGTESDGVVHAVVHGQKRKKSKEELRMPESSAEMASEKKKYIPFPTETTQYPERSEEILESVALCSNKEKALLSSAKCVYNTRHKGTLHTVLKLDQASGFCSPVIGRGRGRGRGRGIVKEVAVEQDEGSPLCGRRRGKEELTGRRRGRARGRGRGRGCAEEEMKDTCILAIEGGLTLLDKAAHVKTESLVTENEMNITTSSGTSNSCNESSGSVPVVKRKRGRASLKPQTADRTEGDDSVHGEKKEEVSLSFINASQNVKTSIRSSSSAANADVNNCEENDKVTTREGEQNNECKNEDKSFLKENEGRVMTSLRRDSAKRGKSGKDKIMASDDSIFGSEERESKEGNTIDDTYKDEEHSPQRRRRRKTEVRRESTNKIPSSQNGKSHEDSIINQSFDYEGSNIVTSREGDQNNECKNIDSNFEGESFSEEVEGRVKTSLKRSSGRSRKNIIMASNDSVFSNEDEQSDEDNTIDNTFEDEEYLPQLRVGEKREGRRAGNRVSSIQGGESHEDSMTNESFDDRPFSGQCERSGMRRERRQRERREISSTRKPVSSNEGEESGEDILSAESCEDNEYSPHQKRRGNVRRKVWRGGGRKKGRGRGRGRGRGGRGLELRMTGDDDTEFQVKCAKCSEEVTNWTFESHNYQKHNLLSWIEGQKPIDTEDEKLVQRILFKVRKQGKKWFTCDRCDVAKKSVVGFMSHMQFCQKTSEEREAMKERCPFCERYLIPSSLKVHLQLHRSEQERQQQQEQLIAFSIQPGKRKRAAAEKATTLMQEFMKGGEDDEPLAEQEVDKDELFEQIGNTKPSNSLIGRWRVAINRKGKIKCKNPGCLFDTSDLRKMEEHYTNCPVAPRKGYVCKLCDHHCDEEAAIREHLKEHETSNPAEETDSSGFEEDDDDGEVFHERTGVLSSLRVGRPKKQRYKVANKMNFLARETSGTVVGDRIYGPALRWTAKFQIQHYKDSLFPSCHTSLEDWTAVEESLVHEYLPVAKKSMMISQLTMRNRVVDLKEQNMEWRKFSLFEAAVKDEAVTMFVGGPVWAMAWCPLPFKLQLQEDPQNNNQYLAITCHRSMEDQYSASRSYDGPGLIQIWCFEDLDSLKSPASPSLAFAIAHNYGAVWCMEWCPSGCYEKKGCETEERHLRRLGLLAAACSDGCIHIFSVCHPDEVINSECDRYPVFKTEPVVSLMLEEDADIKLGGTDWQCLRLSWCKIKDHRIIAGSFSNGMVALWDIETSSRLLYRICGKRKIIYPYHSFQPHGGPVTALAMNPLNERFLMTGSYDRTCKFWDTQDTAEPITSTFKGLVTDGIWLTHWPSAVSAYDDVYSRCHTNSTLTPVRNFGYNPYPLMAQNSVAWTLSSSDWVNSVAQGTSAGEFSAIFMHQLLIGVDTEKGMKNKRMILSYAELVNFKESDSTSDLTESADKGVKKELVLSENVEQQATAAESTTSDISSLTSLNAQISSGTDLGNNSENVNIVSDTHSESACGSSADKRVGELLPSESRDDDKHINSLGPALKEEGGLNENQEINESINVSENSSDMKHLQKTEQYSEDATCTSFSSVRDCDTDTLMCDDSQSVLSSRVNSPTSSQASDVNKQCKKKQVRSGQSDSEQSKEPTQENLMLNPRTYSDIEKNFGIVLCDFPTDDFSQMPEEARLWMRQSDQMRMFPTEMYPALSINRVAWNPNFRSFFWVASGYQSGLVRLKCVSAMYSQDVERNMLRIRDAYS